MVVTIGASPPDAERGPGEGPVQVEFVTNVSDALKSTATEPNQPVTLMTVPATSIRPDPDQPRKHFDPEEHAALVESIRTEGLLQPLGVRPDPGAAGIWILVYGERRYRGGIEAGMTEFPVTVLSRDNSTDVLVTQLVENITRSDLDPLDEARAFERLIFTGMSATDIARKVNKSKGYISHKLALLGLPEPIRSYIEAGLLSEGQVRQLARLKTFYGTETVTFTTADMGTTEQNNALPDEVIILAGVLCLRPLDWAPSYHLPDTTGPAAEVIASSVRALLALVVDEPTQPKWLTPMWFYATMLASLSPEATVAAAKAVVDRHIDHVVSAMAMVRVYGSEPDQWPDMDGWLYLSDLRKAGFDTSDAAITAWFSDHAVMVEKMLEQGGVARPSCAQPGAPQEGEIQPMGARGYSPVDDNAS